ncbi:glycoside hydrolase N-terminal domain-containing protein, partial [Treponema sp. R80B11-R83G3]
TEALPLGNGRLGAMVYGNPAREELQINEETVWGGSPHRNDNPQNGDAYVLTITKSHATRSKSHTRKNSPQRKRAWPLSRSLPAISNCSNREIGI